MKYLNAEYIVNAVIGLVLSVVVLYMFYITYTDHMQQQVIVQILTSQQAPVPTPPAQ